MRHLLSVVLSLILAPLIYIAAGYSAIKLGDATSLSGIQWGAALAGLGRREGVGSLEIVGRADPIGRGEVSRPGVLVVAGLVMARRGGVRRAEGARALLPQNQTLLPAVAV